MIFISGIHGVGKSHFCAKAKVVLGVDTFSASDLISKQRQISFSGDKLISDIDTNQSHLLIAVQELNAANSGYLLDGHFCLLNEERQVTRIPVETFLSLSPDAIILLTENPEIIAKRRKQRDNIDNTLKEIHFFQNEEIIYATEVAETLRIPFKISTGKGDLDNMLDFLQGVLRRRKDNNGR